MSLALVLASLVVAPFSVRVSGHGPDVLLIPGLACSGDVWNGTAAHLTKEHRVHVFTLAGFAGEKAIPSPMLATVREALARYIQDNGLRKPVLVGHSLGGTLALWLAAEHPDLLGGVVAVDGVPFLPALFDPSATAETARPRAEAMRAQIEKLTPAEYSSMARRSLAAMIKSPADIEKAAAWGAASDPGAVARAMYELSTTDLRPAMSRIRVPVLEIAAADFAREEPGRKDVLSRYEAQLAAAPKHRVVLATGARHFIMMDDPRFLLAQLDGFLGEVR